MKRLTKLVERVGKKLEDVHVTLDSHHIIDVGRPWFWRNQIRLAPKYLF